MKDNFSEKLVCIFDKPPKYHMNVFLADINATVSKEDILEQIMNENYTRMELE
jgi:hypothetical protein